MSNLKFLNFLSLQKEMNAYLDIYGLNTKVSVKSDFLPDAYPGELLERYIEQDVIKDNEARLEVLMASTIALFVKKDFTSYVNQITDGLNNFKVSQKEFPNNELMKVVINIYEKFVENKELTFEKDTDLIDLMKNLKKHQIELIVDALSVFELSGRYDEPITKKIDRYIIVLGNLYNHLIQSLTKEKFKELKQSSKMIILIWAGINKKIFKLVKKDYNKNAFFEELTTVSNGLLRDKAEYLKNELISELESEVIRYIGVKKDVLVYNTQSTSSSAESRLSRSLAYLKDFTYQNDLFVNMYQNEFSHNLTINEFDEKLLNQMIYNLNLNDNQKYSFGILRYLNIDINKQNDFNSNEIEKKQYADYFLNLIDSIMEDEEVNEYIFNEYTLMDSNNRDYLRNIPSEINKLFDFFYSNENEFYKYISKEKVEKQLIYFKEMMSKKRNSSFYFHYSVVFSAKNLNYFYKKGIVKLDLNDKLLNDKSILNNFFEFINADLEIFLFNDYELIKKTFLKDFYLSNEFNLNSLLNILKDSNENLIKNILEDYLEIIYVFQATNFVKNIEEIYFEIQNKHKNNELFSLISKELFESLTYVKETNESLIKSSNRKYFAVTVEDIINVIEDIYISKYTDKPIELISKELTSLFKLENIHNDKVQEFLYNKLYSSIFYNFKNSLTLKSIHTYKSLLNKIKEFKLFNDKYNEKLDEFYKELITDESHEEYIDILEDILKHQKTTV